MAMGELAFSTGLAGAMGTGLAALTVLVVAVPLLVGSMTRGSLGAWIVWTATLGYLAYNAVMFCFAAHFNAYFLLYTTLLALSFWALVTQLRAFDVETLRAICEAPRPIKFGDAEADQAIRQEASDAWLRAAHPEWTASKKA